MDVDLSGNFEANTIEENYTIHKNVISKINSLYGKEISNLKNAKDAVSELEKTHRQLQQSLQFATDEAPDKISKAIQSGKEALEKCISLHKELSTLKCEVTELTEKSLPILKVISPCIKKLQLFSYAQIYQTWVKSIAQLGEQLQANVQDGVGESTFHLYKNLQESADTISKSKCEYLKNYTCKTLHMWHDILQNKVIEDFNNSLKAIKWPFTDGPSHSSLLTEEVLLKLNSEIQFIFLLEDSSTSFQYLLEDSKLKKATSVCAMLVDFDVDCLLLQILLKPLEVRFMYHFSGKKATNSQKNPEWYLTHILRWARFHEHFLTVHIQEALHTNKRHNVNAKVEFLRGLARLVMVKLNSDINEALDDEQLLSVIIQETLNFEQEFRAFGYPLTEPSVLNVFTQAHVFFKWRSIEEKFSSELLDEFVTAANAWHSDDLNGPSYCGEQLVLLLQGITSRCKQLPQPGHKLQFVELQLETLDDFRVRLLQMTKSELADPLRSNYCAILNTVHSIIGTLTEWADVPFFIEMQYFRNKFAVQEATLRAAQSSKNSVNPYSAQGKSGEEVFAQLVSEAHEQELNFKVDAIEQFNIAQTGLPQDAFDDVTGSPFVEILKLYSHIQSEMRTVLCEYVSTEARARSQRYRKEKWFYESNNPNEKLTPTEISPSFCPILEVLVKHINGLKQILNTECFNHVWHTTASTLDKFIYEEVILENSFSEYGVAQLNYDIHRALRPIFGEFTKKPESYFTLIMESLSLMLLPLPTAVLLKDVLDLDRDERAFPSFTVSPVKALEENGVYGFTIREALSVLKLRNDLYNL